jgi:hypothetical protein
VTPQEHTIQPGDDPPPYLSLRRAVRPAIAAHFLLAGEQDRAGELAAECEALVLLTQDLLKAAGQARLLTPEPGHDLPGNCGGDRQAQLLGAYAEAGMLWAKVIGSSVALAGTLIDRGDWDAARQLAGFLHDAGETSAAAGLRARLGKAIVETYREQLEGISSRMAPDDIRAAITVLRAILREVPEDVPDRNREVNRLLPPLAASVYAIMKARGAPIPYTSRVEHIATGGVAKYPEIVTTSLDELSAEFEGVCG